MFHPWRALRSRPEIELFWRPLTGNRMAATDGVEVIVMRPGMSQAQRRSTIAHELAHIELGHVNGCTSREESQAAQLAARRLIPVEQLADALLWSHDLEVVAEALWVDVGTLRTRAAHLHPSERNY